MAGAVDLGSYVVLDATSGASSIQIKASTAGKCVLSGFDLTVSGITGAPITLTLREKVSRTVHFSAVIAANPAAASNGSANGIQIINLRITIPASQGLEIVSLGGGTVSGMVFITELA
jgi:hypothetical protein